MKLNNVELENQYNEIVEFLKEVHSPSSIGNNIAFEIRPVNRDSYNYAASKSFIFWRFDNKSLNMFREFLEKHNSLNTCLYYSIYQFDTEMKTTTKKGSRRPYRINRQNAVQTSSFVADFDDVTKEDMEFMNKSFNELGIFPKWLFSGNGYQAIFLLDETTYDIEALKDFIHLLYNKGFPVDLKCIDPSRVMRLPNTFNMKKWKEGVTPKTIIAVESHNRISVSKLMNSLNNLPDAREILEEVVNLDYSSTNKEVEGEVIELKENNSNSYLDRKTKQTKNLIKQQVDLINATKPINYPLDLSNLQEPIRNMMTYVPAGYGLRNGIMGFLVGYFKNQRFLYSQVKEIMRIWVNEASTPPYDVDLDYEVDRFFEYGGLPYSSELTKLYGFIDFKEAALSGNRNHIFLPQLLFEGKTYSNMSPNTLRIILAAYHLRFLRLDVTVKNLSMHLSVSEKTIRRHLPDVLKTGFIFEDKTPVNLKIGEVKKYIISVLKGTKRVLIHQSSMSKILKELKPNEIKVMLYIHFYTEDNNRRRISQTEIANACGYDSSSISLITNSLKNKSEYLIIVDYNPDDNQIEKSYLSII